MTAPGPVDRSNLEERVTTDRSTPNVTSGFAEVNGTKLYWEQQGSGDPILLEQLFAPNPPAYHGKDSSATRRIQKRDRG